MTRYSVVGIAQVASVLLLISSFEHLINPFRFLDGVMQYKLVGFKFARLVAAILPMVCLVAGLSVLFTATRRPGLLLVGLLGTVFMTVQTTALVRNLTIDCGCFDPFRSAEISWRSLLLPVALAVGGFVGFGLDKRDEDSKTTPSGSPQSA